MKAPMSHANIQVGIIGMGHITRNRHLAALRAYGDDVAIRAICDADPAALERGRPEVPDAGAYRDSRELLADPAIDAVLLALPNHLHLDGVRQAAAAGKHILLEKPNRRVVLQLGGVPVAAGTHPQQRGPVGVRQARVPVRDGLRDAAPRLADRRPARPAHAGVEGGQPRRVGGDVGPLHRLPAHRRHPAEQRPGVEKAVELVAAIYRSLDTGAPVPMPVPR